MLQSVSDSSSHLNSISSERPPVPGIRGGAASTTTASPMHSIGTQHSGLALTNRSSSSSGKDQSSVFASSQATRSVSPQLQSRQSNNSFLGGVSSRSVRAARNPNPVGPPRLKKGDKLCWTKGRLLGRGAHGSVFLGLESTSGTLVAVKEMEFDPDDPRLSEKLSSLQIELRLLKRLEHPNIVGYYSAARQATSFLVFMEYVAGGSLASILEQFGRLQETLVMNFANQILNGLMYLHQNSVVHRDIKCANVLISVDGIAKLADFGSAHIVDEAPGTGSSGDDGGTAFWMAPEVIRQETVSAKADIWSFGCTVLEMLTNEIPFSSLGNAFSVMSYVAKGPDSEPVELPPYIKQFLSPVASDLVMKCLQRDPARRASVQELQDHEFFAPLRPRSFLAEGNSVSSSIRRGSESSFRPGTGESHMSRVSVSASQHGVHIVPAILAAAAQGPPSVSESMRSGQAESQRSGSVGDEALVRDHLVKKALRMVTPTEGPPLAVGLSRSTSVVAGSANVDADVTSRGTAEGEGEGGMPARSESGIVTTISPEVRAVVGVRGSGGNPFNSVSSVDTISLSEVSARHSVVSGQTVMSSHDVINVMSNAMQEHIARNSTTQDHSTTAAMLNQPGGPLGGRVTTATASASQHSNSTPEEVITFVVDEDEDSITPRANGDSPDAPDAITVTDGGRSSGGAGGILSCCFDSTASGGDQEGDDDESVVPRRKVNRVQATLLAVTCLLVIVAVVLVIIFISRGQ